MYLEKFMRAVISALPYTHQSDRLFIIFHAKVIGQETSIQDRHSNECSNQPPPKCLHVKWYVHIKQASL